MKKYSKSGWFKESRRHALARLGIKTGRKNYARVRDIGQKRMSKKQYQKIKDKKILDEIRENFDEQVKLIIDQMQKQDRLQLTYGFVPVWRDWFSSELDKKYMYEISPEAQEQVNWMFEDIFDKLSKKGIVVYGDEGDGTVLWAEKEGPAGVRGALREMHYDEKLTLKKAKELSKENKVPLKTIREIAVEEIGSDDIAFAKKEKFDRE